MTRAPAILTFIFISLVLAVAFVPRSEGPVLKTASTHPIQYYLSLPDSWAKGKKYPVVVVIESAERDFLAAATDFARARGHLPFILVTPLVVTNGGAGYRSVPSYHYTNEVWDRIQSTGQFSFDMEGMDAIVQDMVKEYGGDDKFFITGFEAGGHTVWGVLFNHPEQVQAAALVCPNFQGRWVDEQQISSAAVRTNLPIRNLVGTKDDLCGPGHPIYQQMQRAIDIAGTHGYKNVSVVRVDGKGHERLADEVLAYFSTLLPQN